ncbi:phage tail tube protein [Streptomyces sp. NPDC002644]
MPSGNAENIHFAPDGAVYLAPYTESLVLPTSVGDGETAPTGFKALGYVTEAGVTITPTIETTPLPAWQSATPVLFNVDSASFSISMTLLEGSELVTEAFFGADWVAVTEDVNGTPTPTGEYRLDLSSTPDLKEFALVVDWDYKGNLNRAVLGRSMITERGAITLQRTEAQQYELTFSALDRDGELGYVLTNRDMSTAP